MVLMKKPTVSESPPPAGHQNVPQMGSCGDRSLWRRKSTFDDLLIFFWDFREYIGTKPRDFRCPREPTSQGGAGPPSRAKHACGAHVAPPPPISGLLRTFRHEKIKEKSSSRFTIRRRRHLLFFIWRANLDSVLGSGEGRSSPSSSPTFLHRQFHDALHRS